MTEPLFSIWPGWEVSTVGQVATRGGGDVQTGPFGSQLHAADYVEQGIPSVMPQNIGDNTISTEGIARIRLEDAERLSKYRLKTGDIVYSRRGDVEKRSLVRHDNDGWLCGTGCLRIRFGSGHVVPEFAGYYLAHPAAKAWIVQHAVGATMPNLNTKILASLPFVLPSLAEQAAIASILSNLDDKIELNRRMNETLETMAQAIFRDWLVDFGPTRRKIDGVTDPIEIMGGLVTDLDRAQQLADLFPARMADNRLPEGWSEGKVGDVVTIFDSKRVPLSAKEREKRRGQYPYYGATSIMDYVDDYLFDENLLLLGEDGSVVRPNGLPYTQYVWGKIWVNNHAHVLRGLTISTEQLKCFFDITDVAPFVTGAVQLKLNQKNLTSIPFTRADVQIHRAFDHIAEPIFAMIRARSEEIRALTVTRDLLLPKLMSGEIRLYDAACELEAAQ